MSTRATRGWVGEATASPLFVGFKSESTGGLVTGPVVQKYLIQQDWGEVLYVEP